jgi:hypothetical protein
MAESFLEEQLKRMREMSEQMSRATTRAAELSNELARDRESNKQGPLHGVRDLRTYSPRKKSKERSDDHAGHARRNTARGSSRRRRR